MTRLLFIVTLLITLPCAAAIGAIRTRPVDTREIAPLLESPNGCAMPCWMGIRPGETSFDEAVARLDGHAWVGGVYTTLNSVNWEWNGLQPTLFDMTLPTFQGRMELNDKDTIATVVMRTHLRFGDLWAALGAPDRVYLMSPDQPVYALSHVAVYSRYNLYAFSLLSCPMTPAAFWNAPVNLAFGKPSLPYEELAARAPYALPEWFFRNSSPGCA